MAGFDNDVVYGTNVDFTGTSPVSGQINLNGELLVGATVAPFIRAYVPTGSTGVSIATGPGTLDFSLANVPNSALQNSFITVTAGTGLSGGGSVALGGSVSLQLSGGAAVTSVTGTANRITSTGGTTPVIDISAAYVGQSSITTLGTIGSGTWQGTVVGGTYGGTGVNNGASTITLGGSLITSGSFASTFTMTGITSVTFPTSGTLSTTTGTVTSVSGTANQVSVASGTTTPVISLVGPYTPATYTTHGVLIGEGTSSIVALAAGNAGQVLQSGGASADPAYSTATYPATATGTGTILRADGTNWTATTSTYPDTNAVSTLLYASSANVMAALPTANNGVLLTSVAGVPSIGTATVPVGGTGGTSFTAYTVICAGTTSTGNLQNVVALGASGTVLTSNGAATLPSFQTLTTNTVTLTKFTASGTWTKGASTTYVGVLIWNGGAGGGSGRQGSTTAAGGGGGGGSGGASYWEFYAGAFNSTETVTIGGTAAGGIAQAGAASNGNPGTTHNLSTFGNLGYTHSTTTLGAGGTTTSASGGTTVSPLVVVAEGNNIVNLTSVAGGNGGNVTGTTASNQGSTTSTKYSAGSGGGGSGADSTTARQAGNGSSIVTYSIGTTITAGGAGGIETGTVGGGTGNPFTITGGVLYGGSGGGGGGGMKASPPGAGGAGGTPGGGGGGGGGGITGTSSGAGGQGARGEIWVWEFS